MKEERYSRREFFSLVAESQSSAVLVVGGGCAGLSAAVACAQRTNLPVILIDEKESVDVEPRMHSPALFNAAGSAHQLRLGIHDSPEMHAQETLRVGGGRGRSDLVQCFCYEAATAMRQLENQGAVFRERVEILPHGLYPRTHVTADNGSIRKVLLNSARELGVQIYEGLRLKTILQDDKGCVAGGVCEDAFGKNIKLRSRALVLATGGFAGDSSFSARFDRRSGSILSTAPEGSQRYVLEAAVKLGAQLVGMDYLYYETVILSSKGFVPFTMHPLLYILVDENSRRCVNEINAEEVIATLLMKPNHRLWVITSEYSFERSSNFSKTVKNILRNSNEILYFRDLSEFEGECFNASLLEQELKESVSGRDPFGRPASASITPPFLAFPITLVRSRSLGGVHINAQGAVLDGKGEPIAGLFAAGDVVGGIHGSGYIQGNALPSAVIFGRLAGNSAARYVGGRSDIRTSPL